jgi:hypothetical protein
MSHAELASSYAALILADDGIEITVRFDSLLPTHRCRRRAAFTRIPEY